MRYFITKVTMPRRYLQSHLNATENCNMTTYKNYTFCRVGLSTHMMVDEIVVVTKLVKSPVLISYTTVLLIYFTL